LLGVGLFFVAMYPVKETK